MVPLAEPVSFGCVARGSPKSGSFPVTRYSGKSGLASLLQKLLQGPGNSQIWEFSGSTAPPFALRASEGKTREIRVS